MKLAEVPHKTINRLPMFKLSLWKTISWTTRAWACQNVQIIWIYSSIRTINIQSHSSSLLLFQPRQRKLPKSLSRVFTSKTTHNLLSLLWMVLETWLPRQNSLTLRISEELHLSTSNGKVDTTESWTSKPSSEPALTTQSTQRQLLNRRPILWCKQLLSSKIQFIRSSKRLNTPTTLQALPQRQQITKWSAICNQRPTKHRWWGPTQRCMAVRTTWISRKSTVRSSWEFKETSKFWESLKEDPSNLMTQIGVAQEWTLTR